MSLSIEDKKNNIIETIENYGVLDDTNPGNEGPDNLIAEDPWNFYEDRQFWPTFFDRSEFFWNRRMTFHYAVVSDWIARIPGLYWMKESIKYRNVPEAAVEMRSDFWVQYNPVGKSMKVMGGIGTFVLPPDDRGMMIMTLSPACNASTGMPMLISPEVIDHHQIKQGDVVTVTGVWRRMSLEWSSKFPDMNKIKRGYLVVDNPDHVNVGKRNQPVEFHPCTIMEYHENDGLFYDFVFCTADSKQKKYRQQLESFFERYRREKDRFGRYLIAADSNDPLFEAVYNSPAELLRSEPDGRSQLSLITERIGGEFSHRGETIQSIMQKIPTFYPTSKEILALAIQVGISSAELQMSSAQKMAAQLIEISRKRNKLEKLIDQILNNNNTH